MAVLGLQLVFSMVMASVLQKLTPHFSFGRWLLCGRLVRYLHPTDDELKTLAGTPKDVGKGRSKKNDHRRGAPQKYEPFTVPRNLDIQLDTAVVSDIDVMSLHYYTEYQWLVDFSLCSAFIYILTEIYYAILQPDQEFNLSVCWCIMVTLFSLKILYSLTAMYFRTDDSGERMLCITFGFFFLVAAMGVLIVDEDRLEFGLNPAYKNFSGSATEFMKSQGIVSRGPISQIVFKIIIACCCAILGAFLTFPGLRYAKTHSDALKYSKESPFKLMLLHLNFIMPLLIVLLWVKPIARDFFTEMKHRSMDRPLLTPEVFETTRMLIIIAFCLLRITLLSAHLQSHLNIAYERITNLKKESGRISNIDLQRMVTRVFYYLCVVALQYVVPVVLLLFCVFLMKTLGDLSWDSFLDIDWSLKTPINSSSGPSVSTTPDTDGTSNAAVHIALALSDLRKVFTPLFFRGVMAFFCWWLCLVNFTTSSFGLIYYSYFTN
ncbi:transmembrane protein 161B [Lingula anatina]|uniref:Transmembrane protein 161B n=1 Tax=Lingula anatina TaxID=7574 RepID=A0A1S3HJ27_LINAN|nr:transmembrane protein 161B [Lingula anatina]XP_013386126.1 transmembrane protein 161B [Lingula anatina]|eukprot:XP_013386118.1 transmembrane protein 161B [Lingula anatina]